MFTNVFRPMIEMFQVMKLWKFKVAGISEEDILGHPQGEDFEFEKEGKRNRVKKRRNIVDR